MEVDSRKIYQHDQIDDHYLVIHDKTLKCVCELCTCGKHKCPRPRVKGTFSTSYADDYKDIKIASSPPPASAYRYEQRHYNPNDLKTNYQQTYIPKPVATNLEESNSRLESYGSRALYHVPFSGTSSYKDQYQPFKVMPSQQNPEDSRNQKVSYKNVKFEGVTSYNSQYQLPPKVSSTPMPEVTYQRVQIPFQGNSSYKNDFPQYKIQPSPSLEDKSMKYRAPPVKFEGSTSYHDSFKAFTLKLPEQQLETSRHRCAVEMMNVPAVNYVNDKNHIYYDPEVKKFI